MNPFSKIWRSINQPKGLFSFFIAVLFFGLYLFYFRPGYLIIDDLDLISIASGYLGGKPIPFLVFSNVILGFILNLLYGLPGNLNWEILIFIGLNFFSAWAMVYLVLSLLESSFYKATAILAVLACDSYILMNITFTTTATFSIIAGSCLILSASLIRPVIKKQLLFFGSLLILISGLIRIEALLLVGLTAGPALVVMLRKFAIKSLMFTVTVTGCIVAAYFIFDQAYVRSFPEWNSFYVYNNARSLIHDTPRSRFSSVQDALNGAGWTRNDYQMFINWFFPDENTFSITKLQYIVDHSSGRQQGIYKAVLAYFFQNPDLKSRDAIPYLLIILAIWLAAILSPARWRIILPLSSLLMSYVFLAAYLVLTAKIPERVGFSFLTTIALFSLFILLWSWTSEEKSAPLSFNFLPSVALVFVAVSIVLYQAVVTTQIHKQRQAQYVQILSDLEALQAQGKIAANALIVSPAHGIPLEWANPFVVDFPKIQYQEMGWFTFSPVYNEVLRQHQAMPLTTSLYEKDNIYLMVNTKRINGIMQFTKNHEGVKLKANPIFSFRDDRFVGNGYGDTVLFKLVQEK